MWFLASLGAAPVIADAYDREELEAAMVRARPDAVVHQLTDLSTGDSTANARRRLHGTPNLVDAAHAAEVPRIVAQSVAWCYAPGDAPAREDVPLDVGADEPRRTRARGRGARAPRARGPRVGRVARRRALRAGHVVRGRRRARRGRPRRPPASERGRHELPAADALRWPSGPANVCDDEPATAREWAPVFCAAAGAPALDMRLGRERWARGADNHRAVRAPPGAGAPVVVRRVRDRGREGRGVTG